MEQLFFSYSRADSDFVLKLAKDMRSAGANLWIDQLDIAPGDRWDRAVEEALGAAPCLAVILSPELVVSQNVMDEVSLAFDEQKKILPILFRKCNIPFRLRRLQYVDFTANYDAGLAELLGAIKVQQKTDVQAGHDGSDKPTIISTLSSREKAAGAAAPLASARRGEADQKTNGLHLRPGNWFRNWFRSRSFLVGLVLVLAGTRIRISSGAAQTLGRARDEGGANNVSSVSKSEEGAELLLRRMGKYRCANAGTRAVGNQDGWSKDIGHRLGKMPSNRLRLGRGHSRRLRRGGFHAGWRGCAHNIGGIQDKLQRQLPDNSPRIPRHAES